jgi:hypothetical protein
LTAHSGVSRDQLEKHSRARLLSPLSYSVWDGRDGRRSGARREGWYRPRPRAYTPTTGLLPDYSVSYVQSGFGLVESARLQLCEPRNLYPVYGELVITLIDESHACWSDPGFYPRWSHQAITTSLDSSVVLPDVELYRIYAR